MGLTLWAGHVGPETPGDHRGVCILRCPVFVILTMGWAWDWEGARVRAQEGLRGSEASKLDLVLRDGSWAPLT